MIKIAQPLIDDEEKKAVLEVLDSGILAQGPRVKAFEEEFAKVCGVNYAVATSSGTSALHTALLAHGIGPGDEVITSAFTFIATANAILYTGAEPVFVDIDPATYNLQPEYIKEALTPRTRAILPVHLFGLSCDMNAIIKIASQHNLIIIEDACQSHGATYNSQPVGSFGTGAFSFYATKNITSAEGGMVTTNADSLMKKCISIRQHGAQQRYFHDELGFNFCMSDIHAAIGLTQLGKLERFNNARRANAAYFNQHLEGITIPHVPVECKHVYHQYTIRVPGGARDALRSHLKKRGIDAEIYYPKPIHLQACYADRNFASMTLPQTELASQQVLSLPVHPSLTQANLETIVNSVNEFTRTYINDTY